MSLFAKKRLSLLGLIGALILLLLVPDLASAHERRTVGKYAFVVGFLNEPAYANQSNSIDLTICEGSECKYEVKDGSRVVSNPVNDAQKSLKVEVVMGSASPMTLQIAPRFGQPGKYSSYFLPSKTGAYTFHITGTLGSDKIDEKFTSGPQTFGEAETLVSYPPVSNSSDTAMIDMQNQIKEAKDAAGTASIFGIVGILAGLAGLGLAAFAFTRKSKAVVSSTERDLVESGDMRG